MSLAVAFFIKILKSGVLLLVGFVVGLVIWMNVTEGQFKVSSCSCNPEYFKSDDFANREKVCAKIKMPKCEVGFFQKTKNEFLLLVSKMDFN